MPINVSQVKWSAYAGSEGPVYYGSKSFKIPENPTFLHKCMAIVSAVEGHIDAVNMYDSGIVSVGTVQWIERGASSVSDMIGKVADACGPYYVNTVLAPALKLSDAVFKKNAQGKWRFFMKRDGKEIEVNTVATQQQCFLSCDGKKGSWKPENVLHAKTWCAAIASLWDSDIACQAQIDFSAGRLLPWFVTPNAKKILFVDPDETGWKGLLKAIYIQYAVNIPAVADRNLVIGDRESKFPKWSKEYCLDVIVQLAFGSGVTLWPIRYAGLNKRASELFGVSLPVSAKELSQKKWRVEAPAPAPKPTPIVPDPIVPSPTPVVVEPEPEPIKPVPPAPPAPSPVEDSNSSRKMLIIMLAAGGLLTVLTRFLDSCR